MKVVVVFAFPAIAISSICEAFQFSVGKTPKIALSACQVSDPFMSPLLSTPEITPPVKQAIQIWQRRHRNEDRLQDLYGTGNWTNVEAKGMSQFLVFKARQDMKHTIIPEACWDELFFQNKEVANNFCEERRNCKRRLIPRFRRDKRDSAMVEAQIQKWNSTWCNIAEYRKLYKTKLSDCGKWGLTQTRGFYLDTLESGLRDLVDSGIPMGMWGRLASELRETLKEFSRQQSYFHLRVFAIVISGEDRSVEEREDRIHERLDTAGMTKEEVEIQVSLALFDSARRTRQSVDRMFQLCLYLETCVVKPRAALLLAYSQIMSIFLLPEDKPGFIPGVWRKSTRKTLPKCDRVFRLATSIVANDEWMWLGEAVPLCA